MSAPPLFADSLDLAAAVSSLCAERGLGPEHSRAAMRVLGFVIGSGETNHGEALRRVAEAMDGDLFAIAGELAQADAENRARLVRRSHRPARKHLGGKAPAPVEDRWDLD